jgi:hypothetical protein
LYLGPTATNKTGTLNEKKNKGAESKPQEIIDKSKILVTNL